MKYIYKILVLSLLLAITYSCDQGDGRFGDNLSSTGWIEFRAAASTTSSDPSAIEIPLDINVPVYTEGINISYAITAVNGDYTQFVNSTGGMIFVDPTDVTRGAIISLPFQNGDLVRCENIDFDVTLISEDVDGVSLGVDNESIITHRVTILKSDNPDVLPNTYFVGDYSIVDVLATVGPNSGTVNFETSTVTLTVDPLNPNKRIFNVAILPAFLGAQDVTIEFTGDNGVQLGIVNTGIGCTAPEYSYGPDEANGTPWNICDDLSIKVNYTEDINVSCGGPYEASFTLTKL